MSFVNANNYRPRSFSPLQIGPSGLSNSFKTQKKSRKQRTIKNGIVNVDDVHIGCGLGNINWLKIAKQKLTQRELILLRTRQGTLDRLIIDVIQTFTDSNVNQFNLNAYQTGIRDQLLHPQSVIMSRCSQYIAGVCITCIYLVMCLCVKYATNAASQFIGNPPLQQKYSDYLYILIMKSIFEGHIKPANARKMWLIPAMAYPIFLRQFNDNLQIVVNEKSRKNKVIRTQYLRCLNHKCNALRDAFYEEMNRPMTTNRSQISVVSNSNSNRNNGNAFVSDYVQDMIPPTNPSTLPLFPLWPNVSPDWVFDHLNDISECTPLSAHEAELHTTVPMPCRCAACVPSPCYLFCHRIDCFCHLDS
eukprot:623646_1